MESVKEPFFESRQFEGNTHARHRSLQIARQKGFRHSEKPQAPKEKKQDDKCNGNFFDKQPSWIVPYPAGRGGTSEWQPKWVNQDVAAGVKSETVMVTSRSS